MARDTPLGFPAHTLPYRRGEFTTLSTVSKPPPNGGGFVVRTAVRQSAGASNTFLPAEYTARSAFGCRRYTARSSRWAGVRDFP